MRSRGQTDSPELAVQWPLRLWALMIGLAFLTAALPKIVGGWLNPLTHAVDAARALFNGLWDDPQIMVGSVVMGTLALLSLWIASRAFARTNA